MNIKNHVIEGVTRVATAKKGGEITPKVIVMHFTAGWSTEGDIATLSVDERPASAHVVLSREGVFTQIVPFNIKAWHAGPSKYREFDTGLNGHSIGIEISNIGYVQKLSGGRYRDEYGNTMGGEDYGPRNKKYTKVPVKEFVPFNHPRLGKGEYFWEPFYTAQIEALDGLVKALLKTYPTIKYIVSHEEIDTRGWKTDPGPAFPMAHYQALMKTPILVPRPPLKATLPANIPPVKTLPPATEQQVAEAPNWWQRNSRYTVRLRNLILGDNR